MMRKKNTYEHEFYSVLLGESYIPRITSLRNTYNLAIQEHKTQYSKIQSELAQTKADLDGRIAELGRKEKELQELRLQLNQANTTVGQLQQKNSLAQGTIASLNNEVQILRRTHRTNF